MPKQTFLNLPEEKQNRLIKAGYNEFSNRSIHESSMNKILRKANIPKGSFYQYFYDKEEFYWYIVNKVVRERITPYDRLLEEFDGDLFLIEEMQLQEIIHLLQDYEFSNLLRTMFLYNFHEVKQKVFDQSEIDFALMYSIHVEHRKHIYGIKNEDEFMAFFDMLRTLSSAAILGVVSNQYSEEYAIELYERQIDYIRKGLKLR